MRRILFICGTAIILSGLSSPAAAFECPNRFNMAQAAIDDAVKAMGKVADSRAKGLVHTLIDESKMLLAGAKHNHAKPAAGAYDHARAVAKADSALGFARAASLLANR